jgi:DNA-binding transcriptional LysR family regulator
MRFTLRQIEALVAVAEAGSVNAASERLDVSQAAVSSLILGLETALGMTLLVKRRGARATLTPDALSLLPKTRDFLDGALALDDMARQLTSGAFEELRIGARPYLVDRWLREAVGLFQKDHPHLSVSLVRGSNEEILASLAQGEICGGLLMAGGIEIAVPSRLLGPLHTHLYVSADHPLARRTRVSAEEVRRHGFVFPPSGTALERRISFMLERAGIGRIAVVARTEYAEALRMMTVKGVGIGIMFASDAREFVRDGRLVPLPFSLPPVELVLVPRQKPAPNVSEQALLSFIADYLRTHAIGPQAEVAPAE